MERMVAIYEKRFEQGTIAEVWKTIDARKWFDHDFEEFINKELVKK